MKQQTSLKNINILLGFVQVMLLINDHLQQLKMGKGRTEDNFVSFIELTIAALVYSQKPTISKSSFSTKADFTK